MRTRQLRKRFSVTKRYSIGYDVACLVEGCGWSSVAWDYHSNALARGYAHAAERDGAEAA